MKAKVTKEFKGVPDDSNYPVSFKVGDTINGRLAEVALCEGWAEEIDAPKKKESVKVQRSQSLHLDPLPVKKTRGRPRKKRSV